MLTSSAKAKGRRLQQRVRDVLIERFRDKGLQEGDIESRSMGASGVDLMFSPVAKDVIGDYAIECKNVEALNVHKVFFENATKHKTKVPLLVHSKNRSPEPLVTMTLSHFVYLVHSNATTIPSAVLPDRVL